MYDVPVIEVYTGYSTFKILTGKFFLIKLKTKIPILRHQYIDINI